MHSIVSLFTTYLPYFILVLTLLVFVHEYGHYWVARRFGIHAEVFSIGFGPGLFGWTDRNGTRWKVSAIPLGGYVKFLGDNDATSATPSDASLTAEQQRRAFFSQPLHARAAVGLGGKRIDRFEDIQESQFLYLAKPMEVEYRRGKQLLRGEIHPQFCERTD